MKKKLIVDLIPDAFGYVTIREADGSTNGDIDAEPVATFYDLDAAHIFVDMWNKYIAFGKS